MTKNPKYYEIKKCIECGNTFESLISRNQKCCSVSCSNKNISKNKERTQKIKRTKLERYGNENFVNSEKSKKTCIKKYGVDNPSKSREIKEKIKQTNLERFGKEYYFQTDQLRQDIKNKFGVENVSQLEEVKQKKKVTFEERFGVENPFQCDEIKNKIKKGYLEKFGQEYPSQITEIKLKMEQSYRRKFYQKLITTHKCNLKVEPVFSEEDYVNTYREHKYKFRCLKCNSVFEDHIDGGHLPRCQKCYPLNKGSICEQEIYDFLCSFIDPTEITRNGRDIINGELDIYIESKKIGIEYDSFYYHRFPFVSKKYHLEKTKLCESKGIQLIHIFEDEWLTKQDIIKNKLRHILSSDIPSIYARNCIIKEISVGDKSKFLEENHVQGNDKSKIKLGAFHDNELVGVMTFSNYRISLGRNSKENCYELSRFSTNQRVIGLGSKMLKYFITNYKPQKIISYSDKRFSSPNSTIYDKMGFVKTGETEPNYWYFKNGYSKRYHRFGFRKNVLYKKLKNFDDSLTEYENMQNNGYEKIYDCGSDRYELFVEDYI